MMTQSNLGALNDIIKKQYDKYFASLLKDISLNKRFKATKSGEAANKFICDICDDLELDQRQSRYLHNVLGRKLLPSGMKASIRGNKMNEYVKNSLLKVFKGDYSAKLEFEKKHNRVKELHEIPDWTLEINGKIYVGFNQLDLWNGGAQLNRASKYIMDDSLHHRLNKKGIYIICLVARNIELKSYNKVARIIEHGINNKRLFWMKGLKDYFGICK